MTIREKILVIEDEKSISHFISTVLNNNGYEAMQAQTGEEALSMISSHCPDLVILDLGLPDMDGLDILRSLRSWSSLPVVVVSARSHERDKVAALDLGADDYLTKPFATAELLARLRVSLRRVRYDSEKVDEAGSIYQNGGLKIDYAAGCTYQNGKEIHLTPIEYNILLLLMKNPGRVFSTSQIYELVWNDPSLGSENTVAVHIRHLREKIEIDPAEPRYLKVVWGQGYKLEKGMRT